MPISPCITHTVKNLVKTVVKCNAKMLLAMHMIDLISNHFSLFIFVGVEKVQQIKMVKSSLAMQNYYCYKHQRSTIIMMAIASYMGT